MPMWRVVARSFLAKQARTSASRISARSRACWTILPGTCVASGGDVCRSADLVFAGFFVQRLGCHVQAVLGPDDRTEFDRNLGEALGVAQRLEYAFPLAIGEADVANDAVLEREAQSILADDLDAGDGDELSWRDVVHDSSLAQRVDRFQRPFVGGGAPSRQAGLRALILPANVQACSAGYYKKKPAEVVNW